MQSQKNWIDFFWRRRKNRLVSLRSSGMELPRNDLRNVVVRPSRREEEWLEPGWERVPPTQTHAHGTPQREAPKHTPHGTGGETRCMHREGNTKGTGIPPAVGGSNNPTKPQYSHQSPRQESPAGMSIPPGMQPCIRPPVPQGMGR